VRGSRVVVRQTRWRATAGVKGGTAGGAGQVKTWLMACCVARTERWSARHESAVGRWTVLVRGRLLAQALMERGADLGNYAAVLA